MILKELMTRLKRMTTAVLLVVHSKVHILAYISPAIIYPSINHDYHDSWLFDIRAV